jgi:tight adherence protein C
VALDARGDRAGAVTDTTTMLPAAASVLLVLSAGFAARPLLTSPRPIPRHGILGEQRAPARHRRGGRGMVIVAATATATVLIAVVGLLPTAALGIALWGRPRVAALISIRRDRRRRERAFPDAVELLVLTVQSGLTPNQAVRNLVATAPDSLRAAFAAVTHRLDRGAPLADALAALRDEIGPSAGALVDAIAGAERYGLPLAPVLERLADDARAARRRIGEADARRLPVKLSFPLVVCTLPSFVLLAIAPSVLAAISSLGDSAW